MSIRRSCGAILLVLSTLLAAPSAIAQESAATILHLLDYIAVDYAEAVENGKVKNADEFREMSEFAAQAGALLAALPDNPGKAALKRDAADLAQFIANKDSVDKVSAAATALRWAVIRVYSLSVAPRNAPDVARGATLYQTHCATCHGAAGMGDGPAAKGMEPAPSNFHDAARMAQRSAYGLYNTITLGVDGTSMPAFTQLAEDERWALAFHAASHPLAAQRARGDALWKAGKGRGESASLEVIATLSTNEMRARFGEDAVAIQALLLASPQLLDAERPAPLDFSADMLDRSLDTYRKGDRATATRQAITAYLEGFELIEAGLANVDAQLNLAIEREMMAYRGLLQSGASLAEVERRHANIRELLSQAREKLSGGGLSATATFLASLFILLREGVEAILVVAAILAFLGKAGRSDTKRYVHAGWVLALLLGAVTWFIATHVVTVSGANREVTEGVTALIAAAMLLYVGFWLHSKAHAAAWQRYIKDSVGGALSQGTVWTLATVTFLAVYREAFETVLFYQALFAQAGPNGQGAIVGGLVVAAGLLVVIGWIILKASVKLPISLFFAASGILLALLAVVFTGQGIAALQEAGEIGVSSVNFVNLPLLGVYPTAQTLTAQAVVLSAVIVGVVLARRRAVRD